MNNPHYNAYQNKKIYFQKTFNQSALIVGPWYLEWTKYVAKKKKKKKKKKRAI